MGTRAFTKLHTGEGKAVAVLERLYDGDPKVHGLELARFLDKVRLTRGLSDDPNTAAGHACLNAQIVSHFKNGPGDIYLHPAEGPGWDARYEYKVFPGLPGEKITMTVRRGNGEHLFSGTPAFFLYWLEYGEYRHEGGIQI